MIAVQVGEKDMIQPVGMNAHALHGNLCSFAHVHKKLLVTQFHYLRAWCIGLCGFGRPATQYGQLVGHGLVLFLGMMVMRFAHGEEEHIF